ncbi:unnamed protein product [Victoria cruziana]
MHGRNSLEPELIPFEPEIDRLCRDIRARLSLEMGSQLPLGGQAPIGEEPPRLLCEFFIPKKYDRRAEGMWPQIGVNHYEIKAFTINMFASFYDLENKDHYHHLDEFLDICATVRISHIEDDALRLQLFPFSLKEKVKHWFKSLPSSVRIAT